MVNITSNINAFIEICYRDYNGNIICASATRPEMYNYVVKRSGDIAESEILWVRHGAVCLYSSLGNPNPLDVNELIAFLA